MKVHQEALAELRLISEEAKTLIQTFQARISTLYDHKKFIGQIVSGLLAYKKEPRDDAREIVLAGIKEIKTKILPVFAPLHPKAAKVIDEGKFF